MHDRRGLLSQRGVYPQRNHALTAIRLLTVTLSRTHTPIHHTQVCTGGSCVCDAGWTTLPDGLDGAMSPACGYLEFLPSPISECGPACKCAFCFGLLLAA